MTSNLSSHSASSDEELLESSVRIPKHVVYRTFALESVVLNLDTGKYHGLNPVGGRMLEVLERTPKLREAADRLAKEFERPVEEIRRDLLSFCRGLLERGLIGLDDGDR